VNKQVRAATIVIALAVLLSAAAIASVGIYGLMLALRLTGAASSLPGAVPAGYSRALR
jgi:hypothetical protein